jgi:phytoene synthase
MASPPSDPTHEPLPDEARLALAHTAPDLRGALRIFLEFDARLARIVAATSEPMLGQMRLAWWRDALAMPVSQRPQGDPVLDGVGAHWQGQEAALGALVDGWEHMLSEPPLARAAALGFARGRGAGLAGLAGLAGGGADLAARLEEAGTIWALADAASHVADYAERATLLELAATLPPPRRLPAPYRGVAVLGALGARAVRAGGAPLMEGRGAALAALRAGLLGR